MKRHPTIDSPCECEHNDPDSLDARLFFTVVLAVAPAVAMDEASSLSPTNQLAEGPSATNKLRINPSNLPRGFHRFGFVHPFRPGGSQIWGNG